MDDEELEVHDSVMHACGGRREVAREIRLLVDEAIDSGILAAPRSRCAEFLSPLEDADGERDGRDRGTHRFLKAVTVILRLKGFMSRDRQMPIREIELTGQPLLAFVAPARPGCAPAGRPEPVVRALEMAVHLARSSNNVSSMRLAECELSADGGDKCITEIARLVRQVGIAREARFLSEVDLQGNSLDADSVRKIVEAAVKERCERPRACEGAPPLWLDVSLNRVRNPESVFQNLQAWAGWAHGKEGALCLADQEGCSKEACPKGAMLHMPKFLDQRKTDERPVVPIGTGTVSSTAAPAATPASRPAPAPARPRAWRDVEDLPRSQALVRHDDHISSRRRARSSGRRKRSRSRSRRRRGRRRRSASKQKKADAASGRIVLMPGPGRGAHGGGRGERSPSRWRSQRGRGRAKEEPRSEDVESALSEGASSAGGNGQALDCDGMDDAYSDEAASNDYVGGGASSAGGASGGRGLSSEGSCVSASRSPSPAVAPTTAPHAAAEASLEERMDRLISHLKGSTRHAGDAAKVRRHGGRSSSQGACEQRRRR